MSSGAQFDVIIIGAGAAGMMCALTAGQNGAKVLLLDHTRKIGEKIRISGGGRCNFTNIHCNPKNFLSQNPRFCISALKRYGPQKFIDMVNKHEIAWHDKGAGQLFCDDSATQIIEMLFAECRAGKVTIWSGSEVKRVEKPAEVFSVHVDEKVVTSKSLVIATGGLSIPKIGATGFGHSIAQQFGHSIIDLRPGLVPLTFSGALLESMKSITGLSQEVVVKFGKTQFREALLFTHRGLSGPVILQISSYWRDGQPLMIDLVPDVNVADELMTARSTKGKQDINNVLCTWLPKRLADFVCQIAKVSGRLADLNKKQLAAISNGVNHWQVLPQGTEGYRTAEVTLGGVDTKELSSKTMESNLVSNLYFVGEVMDVTGHLGGHNFQWAWSSGHAAGLVAGQAVS